MNDSPAVQLGGLINGFWMTQSIYVAAKLGIADRLAAGALSVDELATQSNSHAPSLFRLLRALASIGVFQFDDQQRVCLTPMSELLRSEVAGSLRSMILMRGDWQYRAWGELEHCIRTGESAFEKLHGQSMFGFLSTHPEQGGLFDAAMQAIHGRETTLMLDAYDFSPSKTVVDVGGGNGSLLREILRRNPAMCGVLFDLPSVIARTTDLLKSQSSPELSRLQSQAGDFFESIPTGGDAYVLRHIIHDWDDARSRQILTTCRRAMSASSKLLLAEFVIPPGNGRFLGKWFDLAMLVGPGGQERTADEYASLLAAAGFRLTRIVPTTGEISLVEATCTP